MVLRSKYEPMAQITTVNLQIHPAIRGFRSYVKRIEEKAFYRFEKYVNPSPYPPSLNLLEKILKLIKILFIYESTNIKTMMYIYL